MQKILKNPISYTSAFFACFIMMFATGCASGGYKLTRSYAGFVNKQNIILRVVLYILTGIVFAVTLLIDAVVFNTMDFWEGKVSAGSYKFQDGDKTFHVRHEIVPGTELRRSTIHIVDEKETVLQVVALNEAPNGQIEMYVNGKLRTRVNGIKELPVVSQYDADENLISEQMLIPTHDSKQTIAASL